MANVHFMRKIASDALYDTLFFVDGRVPVKTKDSDSVTLSTTGIKVKIVTNRNITVNTVKCRSLGEARNMIQRCM